MAYLSKGEDYDNIIILIHGNVSSCIFWDEIIDELGKKNWILAPDLRGYGDTEALPIDATKGVRDWSEDIKNFVDALGIKSKFHIVGWSLGGGVAMQYVIDYPEDISTLTLISPVSPYGFGGTKGIQGEKCNESFSGTGGGTANPIFVQRLRDNDKSEDDNNSPKSVMNNFYFKPPFKVDKAREDKFVQGMLKMKIEDDYYPGNYEDCVVWPYTAPGDKGINNTLAPKYFNLTSITEIDKKPPILWVRGKDDQIVSDNSFFDLGTLGKLGFIPNWPGDEVYPSQPMVSQTREIFNQYKANGGIYKEIVFEKCGHSPHIEKQEEFLEVFSEFIEK
nr:alpha/beta hydrolase [Oceanirhabdus seepicola]